MTPTLNELCITFPILGQVKIFSHPIFFSLGNSLALFHSHCTAKNGNNNKCEMVALVLVCALTSPEKPKMNETSAINIHISMLIYTFQTTRDTLRAQPNTLQRKNLTSKIFVSSSDLVHFFSPFAVRARMGERRHDFLAKKYKLNK